MDTQIISQQANDTSLNNRITSDDSNNNNPNNLDNDDMLDGEEFDEKEMQEELDFKTNFLYQTSMILNNSGSSNKMMITSNDIVGEGLPSTFTPKMLERNWKRYNLDYLSPNMPTKVTGQMSFDYDTIDLRYFNIAIEYTYDIIEDDPAIRLFKRYLKRKDFINAIRNIPNVNIREALDFISVDRSEINRENVRLWEQYTNLYAKFPSEAYYDELINIKEAKNNNTTNTLVINEIQRVLISYNRGGQFNFTLNPKLPFNNSRYRLKDWKLIFYYKSEQLNNISVNLNIIGNNTLAMYKIRKRAIFKHYRILKRNFYYYRDRAILNNTTPERELQDMYMKKKEFLESGQKSTYIRIVSPKYANKIPSNKKKVLRFFYQRNGKERKAKEIVKILMPGAKRIWLKDMKAYHLTRNPINGSRGLINSTITIPANSVHIESVVLNLRDYQMVDEMLHESNAINSTPNIPHRLKVYYYKLLLYMMSDELINYQVDNFFLSKVDVDAIDYNESYLSSEVGSFFRDERNQTYYATEKFGLSPKKLVCNMDDQFVFNLVLINNNNVDATVKYYAPSYLKFRGYQNYFSDKTLAEYFNNDDTTNTKPSNSDVNLFNNDGDNNYQNNQDLMDNDELMMDEDSLTTQRVEQEDMNYDEDNNL